MSIKKKIVLITGVILFILSVIGLSYAYWILNLKEESTNLVQTRCLKLSFKEEEAINIQKNYPLTDEAGSMLSPYELEVS